MKSDLYQQSLLTLLDLSPSQIQDLVDDAAMLKAAKARGEEVTHLKGKNIALIFEKTSTRTRCAFEVAAFDQGAQVTYLGRAAAKLATKKP